MVHVTEELLLLAYDEDKGIDNSYTNLSYGLAGGVLVDLALHERIEISQGQVVVVNSSPLGNAVLDNTLAQLTAAPKPRKPATWMNTLYWGINNRVRDGLVSQGILHRQKDRWLGLFPYSKYLPTNPTVKREVLERLENAARSGVADSTRTAALAGLVHTLWLEKKAVPALPRSQARKALKAVGQESPHDAVNDSLQASRDAVNAAVAAAAVVVVAAGAASGS